LRPGFERNQGGTADDAGAKWMMAWQDWEKKPIIKGGVVVEFS